MADCFSSALLRPSVASVPRPRLAAVSVTMGTAVSPATQASSCPDRYQRMAVSSLRLDLHDG
jgi:hypothetical protein